MVRWESASKAALAQGRLYIGSSEGEDLQVNFRPAWSRTPKLDVVVGDGSFEDKVRNALDARKVRTMQEKVDFMGYANFQGHILDWGVKMIVTRAMTAEMLIAYQMVLARVAEEFGGVRTAYYYDLLLRQQLAKKLEDGSGTVEEAVCRLDREVLADARQKVEVSARSSGALSSRNQQTNQYTKGGGKGGRPSGGKGANVSHQGTSAHGQQWPQRSRSPKQKQEQKQGGDKNRWAPKQW